MLIHCPECSQKISEKAPFCPHCGLPAADFQENTHKVIHNLSTGKRSRKKKRLPNGFGQITKIFHKDSCYILQELRRHHYRF